MVRPFTRFTVVLVLLGAAASLPVGSNLRHPTLGQSTLNRSMSY